MSAARSTLSDDAHGFYTWIVPGAPIQIHLHLRVTRQIRDFIGQRSAISFSGISRKCGLLLGKPDVNGDSDITDFRPLSSLQAEEMRAAITSLENEGNDLRPIGFFRTHNQQRLCLTQTDLSLAQALFSHPNCVFLLIRPVDNRAPNAGFFFWDTGRINADFCFLEFPFDATTLAYAADGKAETKPLGEPTFAQPPNLPSTEAPTPTTKAESRRFRANAPTSNVIKKAAESIRVQAAAIHQVVWNVSALSLASNRLRFGKIWLLASVLLALMAVVSWSRLHGRDQIANSASAHLRLRVEPAAGHFRVSWDHTSPAVQYGGNGVLKITDGSLHRDIQLDSWHVAHASVEYVPLSPDVTFRLQIRGKRGLVTESVRVSNPSTRNSAVRQDLPLAVARTEPRTAARSAPKEHHNLSTAESNASLPITMQSHPAGPVAKPALAAPGVLNNHLNSVTLDYSPPRPLKKVMPETREYAPRILAGIREVSIQISINSSGRVTAAKPVTDGSQSDELITAAAISAAKQWMFEPARFHGRPVPSEHTILFSFRSPAEIQDNPN